MQAHYEPAFEREMGCTVAELRGWLPGASAGAPLAFCDDGVDVALDGGELRLRWQTLPPRRIAMITLPRLRLKFDFQGIDEVERQRFMRHFDLYTQRGGG